MNGIFFFYKNIYLFCRIAKAMEIPFPAQYKKQLVKGVKNTTIRVGAEKGKYSEGEIYRACSYAGKDWGVDVKILNVIKLKVKKLKSQGIPLHSINYLIKRNNVTENSEVELIRFRVV